MVNGGSPVVPARGLRRAAKVLWASLCAGTSLVPSCVVAQQPPIELDAAAFPASRPDLPERPDILGTVALHIPPNPTSTRWSKLMQASLAQSKLRQAIDGLSDLPGDEQVLAVQSIMSAAVRSVGAGHCSDDGYWAPAQETLLRGAGDCFDVAIAKMEALRSLGMASADLYLTTGRLRPAIAGTARETVALLVRVGPRFWLLPDWTSHALEVDGPDAGDSTYSPIITYGVGASWVHGRRVRLAALETMGAGPAHR